MPHTPVRHLGGHAPPQYADRHGAMLSARSSSAGATDDAATCHSMRTATGSVGGEALVADVRAIVRALAMGTLRGERSPSPQRVPEPVVPQEVVAPPAAPPRLYERVVAVPEPTPARREGPAVLRREPGRPSSRRDGTAPPCIVSPLRVPPAAPRRASRVAAVPRRGRAGADDYPTPKRVNVAESAPTKHFAESHVAESAPAKHVLTKHIAECVAPARIQRAAPLPQCIAAEPSQSPPLPAPTSVQRLVILGGGAPGVPTGCGKKAVVVGVDAYASPGLAGRDHSVADAQRMAAVLEHLGCGVVALYGEEATAAAVAAAVRAAACDAACVVIYISSHCAAFGGAACAACYDSLPSDAATWLPLDAAASAAAHLVLCDAARATPQQHGMMVGMAKAALDAACEAPAAGPRRTLSVTREDDPASPDLEMCTEPQPNRSLLPASHRALSFHRKVRRRGSGSPRSATPSVTQRSPPVDVPAPGGLASLPAVTAMTSHTPGPVHAQRTSPSHPPESPPPVPAPGAPPLHESMTGDWTPAHGAPGQMGVEPIQSPASPALQVPSPVAAPPLPQYRPILQGLALPPPPQLPPPLPAPLSVGALPDRRPAPLPSAAAVPPDARRPSPSASALPPHASIRSERSAASSGAKWYGREVVPVGHDALAAPLRYDSLYDVAWSGADGMPSPAQEAPPPSGVPSPPAVDMMRYFPPSPAAAVAHHRTASDLPPQSRCFSPVCPPDAAPDSPPLQSPCLDAAGSAAGADFVQFRERVGAIVTRAELCRAESERALGVGHPPPALGVELADYHGPGGVAGVQVLSLRKGGAAHRAGLQPGDVVVALQNQLLAHREDFRAVLAGGSKRRHLEATVLAHGVPPARAVDIYLDP